jgi:hypothetical protein
MRNARTFFVRKSLKERPFGRSRYIWEDNNEKNLHEIACETVDLTDLDQERVLCSYEHS